MLTASQVSNSYLPRRAASASKFSKAETRRKSRLRISKDYIKQRQGSEYDRSTTSCTMVNLRSGTDTEDNEGVEVSSRHSSPEFKQNTTMTRAGAASHQQLAKLREDGSDSGEPSEDSGCDWPLAQQVLADLQELCPQQRGRDPLDASQSGFQPMQQDSAGLWTSHGLKGWLDYHLGHTQDEDTGLSSDPAFKIGAQHEHAAGHQQDQALPWHPVSQLAETRSGTDDAEALLQENAKAAYQMTIGPWDKTQQRRKELRQAPKTAGRDWHDLPATRIDDRMKRDLRLLRLRSAMDPKRFYKSPDSTKFPKFFQVGTVVAGPHEFYSGRMTKRDRKASITEELLADKALREQRRRRFGRLQTQQQQWAGRRGRKTDNARIKKRRKAPKH